jgi:hypothetical protein
MNSPASLPPVVARALARVGRRRRALAAIEAVCWTALGLAVLVLVAPLVGAGDPPTWLRWLARGWLLLWLVVPFALLFVPPWIRTGDALALARAVDDRVPRTRDSLLTAVDLARALDEDRLDDPVTRHLTRDHLHQASRRALDIDLAVLLPVSGLGWPTWVGPVVAGIALVVALLHPVPTRAGLTGLLGDRLPADNLAEVDAAPEEVVNLLLRNVSLTLKPPAYTGREPLVLEGTTGDFQALPGTEVTLHADLPVDQGAALVAWSGDDGDAQDWEAVVGDARLGALFTVPGGGSYRIRVERGRLRSPLQTRSFSVEALPDHAPDLEISGATDAVELRGEDTMTLQVRTEDDFGLTRLELVVLRRGTVVGRETIADVTDTNRFDQRVDWSAASVEGGGQLELVVESWDNDTVNGPKVTRSRSIDVYVPTAADHHDRVLAMKRQLLDRCLDLLASLLVTNDRAESTAPRQALVEEFDHQDRLARGLFDAASTLDRAMRDDALERQGTWAGVGQLSENLARSWGLVQELVETRLRHGDGQLVVSSEVELLVALRRGAVEELERAILDLGAFVDLHVGQDALSEALDLDASLADLADLLRQAEQGKPVDEALEQALQQLAQELAELGRELAQRSRGPDDGFVNSMPQDLDQDLLSEIRELAAEGDLQAAMDKVAEAMEAVAALQEQLQGEASQMAGSQMAQQYRQQLDESLEAVRELEEQQQGVIDDTEQLEQEHGSGEPLDPAAQQELEDDVARLQEMIDDLPPDSVESELRGAMRQWLRLADRSADRLAESLSSGRLDDAADYGAQTGGYLEETGIEVDEAAAKGATSGVGAARRQTREAAALAQDIARRLDQAERRSRSSRTRAADASQPVQDRQEGVREGVSELRQQVEQMGGSAFNPVGGRQNLEAAEELMERAGDRLGQGRTSPAMAAEKDALQQLQAFRESLESTQEAMDQRGQGMPQPGSMAGAGPQQGPWDRFGDHDGFNEGEVELSDPDDFVSPEAFRALVQEEAAGDAPERYLPLNGSYYEELVR